MTKFYLTLVEIFRILRVVGWEMRVKKKSQVFYTRYLTLVKKVRNLPDYTPFTLPLLSCLKNHLSVYNSTTTNPRRNLVVNPLEMGMGGRSSYMVVGTTSKKKLKKMKKVLDFCFWMCYIIV